MSAILAALLGFAAGMGVGWRTGRLYELWNYIRARDNGSDHGGDD